MSSPSTLQACETVILRGIRRNRTTACSRAHGWKPGHSGRACYRLLASPRRKRECWVSYHMLSVGDRLEGTGFSRLQRLALCFRNSIPKKIRDYFKEPFCYRLDARRSREPSPQKNTRKIWEISRTGGGHCNLRRFWSVGKCRQYRLMLFRFHHHG